MNVFGRALTKSQIRLSLSFSVKAEEIQRSLADKGLRCTPQRYAVMSFLLTHEGHPTAAEIFEAVNRLDPRCSRATTYNNLRDLVQSGLVREVAVEGRSARFDARGMRHHHFICDQCGVVEDLCWHEVSSPSPASMGKRILRESEIIFRGLCERCAVRNGQGVSSAGK